METRVISEFQRTVELEELDDGEIQRTIEADGDERQALARRFDLVAIDALRASVRIRRVAGGPLVRVEGRLTADVVQRCVVTLSDVPQHIEEDFVETFGPAGYRAPDASGDADLPEAFDDRGVDLGELAAQLLFLSLDAYPRAAAAGTQQQGDAAEATGDWAHPFAGLSELLERRRK